MQHALPPPPNDPPHKPGAQAPRYRWLTFSSLAVFLLLVANATQWVRVPILPLLAAFVVLIALNAIRFFPGTDDAHIHSPARRRFPLLALLALPWIASILCGPLGFIAKSYDDPVRQSWMVLFQQSLLAAAVILPLALLPAMRGGRMFTLMIGLLNLLATFLITSVSITILDPGS